MTQTEHPFSIVRALWITAIFNQPLNFLSSPFFCILNYTIDYMISRSIKEMHIFLYYGPILCKQGEGKNYRWKQLLSLCRSFLSQANCRCLFVWVEGWGCGVFFLALVGCQHTITSSWLCIIWANSMQCSKPVDLSLKQNQTTWLLRSICLYHQACVRNMPLRHRSPICSHLWNICSLPDKLLCMGGGSGVNLEFHRKVKWCLLCSCCFRSWAASPKCTRFNSSFCWGASGGVPFQLSHWWMMWCAQLGLADAWSPHSRVDCSMERSRMQCERRMLCYCSALSLAWEVNTYLTSRYLENPGKDHSEVSHPCGQGQL